MPAFCSASAVTGPAIPPPMTIAVRVVFMVSPSWACSATSATPRLTLLCGLGPDPAEGGSRYWPGRVLTHPSRRHWGPGCPSCSYRAINSGGSSPVSWTPRQPARSGGPAVELVGQRPDPVDLGLDQGEVVLGLDQKQPGYPCAQRVDAGPVGGQLGLEPVRPLPQQRGRLVRMQDRQHGQAGPEARLLRAGRGDQLPDPVDEFVVALVGDAVVVRSGRLPARDDSTPAIRPCFSRLPITV